MKKDVTKGHKSSRKEEKRVRTQESLSLSPFSSAREELIIPASIYWAAVMCQS